jgi:hypothetical protein
MDERTERQLGVIRRVTAITQAAGISAWLFGALATQPPEESCEFTWDDVPFSAAYFDRQPDGSFSQVLGRWSDLAMKEQFPHLRNGRPWRPKDTGDIEILRRLAAE